MDDSPPEPIDPAHPDAVGASLPEDRVALNETSARTVNEAIEAGRVSRDGLVGFVCECGRLGCNSIVELTLEQYEAVRAHSRHFLLVDGHESGPEVIARRTARYAVVSKQGLAGVIAELTDPRAEST